MTVFMDFMAGVKMTIVSGVFLTVSLILMLTGVSLFVDPAWLTIIISGLPLLYLAFTRLVYQKWISSALLISIAMIASIAIGEIFAAGEVAFIMSIGAILEELTVSRAKKGIGKLLSLVPQEGRRLTETTSGVQLEMVSIDAIGKGDLLRILPGETIPVDGIIVDGHTSIDQSVMTGESLPVDRKENDAVFSGTVNCYGSIDICATEIGKNSSLQKMIDLVKQAEEKKAPMQKIVDKWATWLVPIALIIAVAAYFVTGELIRAVTILVVFCPCALALATPTSIVAAIAQATRHGVLIKSGEALERMGKADSIAFDKTGTLTYGNLTVSDTITFEQSLDAEDLLSKAAAVESRSEHPVGKAIVQSAEARKLKVEAVERFQMDPGKGVSGMVAGKTILCGNQAYLSQYGVEKAQQLDEALERFQNQGKATVIVAEDSRVVGVIALADAIRPQSKEVIEKLEKMGVEVVLLTGDNHNAASYLANQIGIRQIRAELLPEEKVAAIEALQKENKKVCMIGDGVNDAPALKMADVSVAMGSMGSDIAIEAADIALMSDDIGKIAYLKRLSNGTIQTIKGNIAASMVINAIAVICSVLGYLTPVTGAIVHNVGSVLVVLSAALLYDRKFDA